MLEPVRPEFVFLDMGNVIVSFDRDRAFRQMAEVGQRQGQPERGDDDLQEFAAVLLEAGAQGFVTVDDGIDRLFQQGDIERAFESEAHRHVEGSDFGLEQFQIPEDLLGDRGGKCQRLLRAGGR